MRRGLLGPLVKSALFVTATVTTTAILGLSIAGTDTGATTGYQAKFTDASGLHQGDSVRIAGVEVGHVQSISVTDKRLALVKFTVQKGRRLPSSTTATIKYLNLVGLRFLELAQGSGATGDLRPGGTIPVEQTMPSLNLTQLFNGFQPLFQALSPDQVNQLSGELIQVLQGEGANMSSLLGSTADLTSTLAGKDQVIGQVINNLNDVLNTVNSRGDKLGTLIQTIQQLVNGLSNDRKPIGQAIQAMSDLTTSTAGLLQDGRAPLKADIVQLGRLSDNLNQASPTVDRFLRTLPTKLAAISRIASYGSWLNFYLCNATVTGVHYQQFPNEPHYPDPTGVTGDPRRCGS